MRNFLNTVSNIFFGIFCSQYQIVSYHVIKIFAISQGTLMKACFKYIFRIYYKHVDNNEVIITKRRLFLIDLYYSGCFIYNYINCSINCHVEFTKIKNRLTKKIFLVKYINYVLITSDKKCYQDDFI